MPDLTAFLDCAHNLVGLTIVDGWKATEKIQKSAASTGGHFSVGYIVEKAGHPKAFMKVLDLTKALSMSGDQLSNIQDLISQFTFERDALKICGEFKLKRIASAIADGKMDISGNPFGVYYIIFEMADGDVRNHLKKMKPIDYAWMLRGIHQVAAGLAQLHSKDIAHQDLKPSNVLVFAHNLIKIGDLGCADIKGRMSPRGHYKIAGDRSYAPPELLYSETPTDWRKRRLGTDMYLFGSLITFLFAQATMTAAIKQKLHPMHRPGFWPHDFRTALPYVRNAFGKVMADIKAALPDEFREDLYLAILQLCDPDPNLRGHPDNLNISQHSFERYVSLFNKLAKRAEIGAKRK